MNLTGNIFLIQKQTHFIVEENILPIMNMGIINVSNGVP